MLMVCRSSGSEAVSALSSLSAGSSVLVFVGRSFIVSTTLEPDPELELEPAWCGTRGCGALVGPDMWLGLDWSSGSFEYMYMPDVCLTSPPAGYSRILGIPDGVCGST
jgi:hypothetical protein